MSAFILSGLAALLLASRRSHAFCYRCGHFPSGSTSRLFATPTTHVSECSTRTHTGSSRPRRCRDIQLLGDETLATGAGVVVAAVAVVAVGQALTTLAGAFNLADYRTTTGHDLRLNDRRLQSQCRKDIHPLTGRVIPGTAATTDSSPTEEALIGVTGDDRDRGEGKAEAVDWRDEVRKASDLPLDG